MFSNVKLKPTTVQGWNINEHSPTASDKQRDAEGLHVPYSLSMTCQGQVEAAQPITAQGVSACTVKPPLSKGRPEPARCTGGHDIVGWIANL